MFVYVIRVYGEIRTGVEMWVMIALNQENDNLGGIY